MKKIARIAMISTGMNCENGRFSTMSNSTWAGFTVSISPSFPSRYMEMAVPPITP